MRAVTKMMIKEFQLEELGFDFMGYTFKRRGDLSFHHLIIPRRFCKCAGIGQGFLSWNGSILNRSTAHAYLHSIERIDPEIFNLITSEMIDENMLQRIEISNLRRIRDLLLVFEKEHDRDITGSGKYVIRPSYVENRISLK